MDANGEEFQAILEIGTAYDTRMSRWSKNGVLDRILARLRQEQMPHVSTDALSLDSTVIKVHPDGTGALKKTALSLSANPAADGQQNCIQLPHPLNAP